MHTASLAILSTLLDETNFLTKMISYKQDDGKYFFKTFHLGLICKECLKKDKPEEMIQCPHDMNKNPPWKSNQKLKRLKEISLQFDNAGRGLRENFGVAASSYRQVLPREHIKSVFDEKAMQSTSLRLDDPTFIVMTVDPNAGGDSETAIVSGYFIPEPHTSTCFTAVVLGVDALNCRDSIGVVLKERMILNHIGAIRQRFGPSKRIIFIPENQTGDFHYRASEIVQNLPGVKVFYQNADKDKPGVTKTQMITSHYVQRADSAFEEKAVAFDKFWFTTTTIKAKSTIPQTRLMADALKDELLRFCINEKGKLTGKINGYTDDKAIAFMMLIYWGNTILTANRDNPYLTYLPEAALLKFFPQQLWRKGI